MKLIDILVEETIENGWSWPERANCITQDRCREIMPATCQPSVAKFEASYNRWFLNGSRIDCFTADVLASDYETAIITREQYKSALAAKNDDWIEWGGGNCPPVSTNTAVDVKFKNGYVQSGYSAGEYSWAHAWQSSNIIAYRLHQPKEAEHSEESEEDLNECIGQDAAQVWGGEGKPAIGEKCEHHSGGQWEAVTIAGIYENLVTGFTDYWMVKEDGSSYTVGNPYRFRPIRSEADKKREDALDAIYGAIASAERAHNRSDEADKVYEAIAAGKIPGVKLED